MSDIRLRDISLTLGAQEYALRGCLYQSLLDATEGKRDSESLRVLDIGCGRGELMKLLRDRGHHPTGIDLEVECVGRSAAYGEALRGGFLDVPVLFQPGQFDVVVSSHVLEHVDSPLDALSACRAITAHRYVFAVPNVHRCSRLIRTGLGSSKAYHPTHVYGWGRPEFEALLRRAGFQVIRWHADRVTVNPLNGRIGAVITRLMSPVETRLLPRFVPWLSSSLIVECRIS